MYRGGILNERRVAASANHVKLLSRFDASRLHARAVIDALAGRVPMKSHRAAPITANTEPLASVASHPS